MPATPRTAYEIKDLHRRLSGFDDDELKRMPVVAEGERLRQGASYINLREAEPREFTATAEMRAEEGDRIVAKDDVGYPLWNRLTGEGDPRPQTEEDR